jgi:hypothetical protein
MAVLSAGLLVPQGDDDLPDDEYRYKGHTEGGEFGFDFQDNQQGKQYSENERDGVLQFHTLRVQ